MKSVVLYSGGLDSSVALKVAELASDKVFPLYVDTGGRQGKGEKKALSKQCRIVKLLLPWWSDDTLHDDNTFFVDSKTDSMLSNQRYVDKAEEKRTFVVRMRNLVFLSIATSYAASVGAEEVYCGFDYHGVDKAPESPAWDKRHPFMMAFEKCVAECNEWAGIRFISPIQGRDKAETVRMGIRLGVDFSKTWTCYNDLEYHCGVCPACVDRRRAFKEVGEKDPLKYYSEKEIKRIMKQWGIL